MILLLLACTENEFHGKDDVEGPSTETGLPDCPPQIPDCHDSEVETDEPIDTEPVNPEDCDVDVAASRVVDINDECKGTGGGGGEVDDAFDLSIEYQYTSSGNGAIVMPAIGNLTDDNGDGKIDENDIPDIAFTTWSGNTLVVLSGDGSGVIFEKSGYNGQGGVTIADADADGDPEVIAITTTNAIALVNGAGVEEWRSNTFAMMQYPQPTVADLDGDGKPEVIGDIGIVNGEDGTTVGTIANPSNSWRTPIAADIDQDGTQEIILANIVANHKGQTEWTNPGSGYGNFGAVANIDNDNEAEVFFVSGSQLFIHEDDGTLIRTVNIPGSNPGPPSIADFDGDGEIEIAIPANTQLSVFDVDGTQLWTRTINDTSGLAGASGYDMNGDGAYEVLFADQDALRIYDGAAGTVLYENYSHSSGTVWEYPVIADIDQDDSAEICIASNGSGYKGVTCFGHNGDGWPQAGPTWGTHDFAVTNIDPDGSVPKKPEASWLKYNVFRARPSVDDPATSDLGGKLTEICVADCNDGPVKISFQVWNEGAETVAAGTPYALYRIDQAGESIVTTGLLPEIPAGYAPAGIVLEITPDQLGEFGFVLVLDYNNDVAECDEDNNRIEFLDSICQ